MQEDFIAPMLFTAKLLCDLERATVTDLLVLHTSLAEIYDIKKPLHFMTSHKAPKSHYELPENTSLCKQAYQL